ncbi:alpha/beta hydrolase [Actinomyces gaoshouyii]|uniref:Alpha/beta hydrolase n=1 Tax=Actinomyces gaoshouyii TaxID=1960083 RepID=A0A8H9LKJ3_9ACTO|nr:alpha/beta hydrolase [Actinomyces gaoshouyii]GGO94874.1 alpha/beta hydrolase [Actinomyces gaoshouyii]
MGSLVRARHRTLLAILSAASLSLGLTACLPGGPGATGPGAPGPAAPAASSSSAAVAPASSAAVAPATDPATSTTAAASPTASASPSATAATAPSAAPGAADLSAFLSQSVAWENCDLGDASTCATIAVPLDYSQPGGQTITLALRKMIAADGKGEKGSLVINPGGPGASGLDYVPIISDSLSPRVRNAYDIVGFDPRGVGKSTPLTCWTAADLATASDQASEQVSEGQEATPESKETTVPDEAAQVGGAAGGGAESPDLDAAAGGAAETSTDPTTAAEAQAQGAALAKACAQNSQVPELLDHMDSQTVIRDMDVIRSVLGDEKLSFLGASYGTYLGAAYIRAFPQRTGTMILDSALDPSLTRAQVHSEDMASTERRALEYITACQSAPGCPLTGTPEEGRAQLLGFIESADAQPLALDTTTTTLRSAELRSMILYIAKHSDIYWAQSLPGLSEAMSSRNATKLYSTYRAALQASSRKGNRTWPPLTADQRLTKLWNTTYVSYAVHCADYPNLGDATGWDAQAANAKKAAPLAYSGRKAYMDAICHGWGRSASAPQHQAFSSPTTGPVLVIGNKNDPTTPYAWSESLSRELTGSRLISVDEAIHGAVGRNSCATKAVNETLLDGSLPTEGTTCPADTATGQ